MTQLGLQCYCTFACLLCQCPWYPFSPSLQVHSYIDNHQHELYFSFSVRCCALGAEVQCFPISLGFPFPTFSLTPHSPRGGGGDTFTRLFPEFPFPHFPTPYFPELNSCVFGGGDPCIRRFLEFPFPHFPFQLPIFSPTHHCPEVKFLCVCVGAVLHFEHHFSEVKFLCVWGGAQLSDFFLDVL